MRTKRATRNNPQSEHNSFGIYNWFKLRGITDKEVINETIYNFCQDNGYNVEEVNFSNEKANFNWVANRFRKFAPYAGKFLKDNNYLKSSS